MHIAILTFDGFNELDSMIALGILNRINQPGWRVSLASPNETVISMNNLQVHRQASLEAIETYDAVLFGSGIKTREIGDDADLMRSLQRLDPSRQLIGAQCSGTLLLAKLGLLNGLLGCTDTTTKPWVQEAGIEVLEQPFFARENIATAGGCLASIYLAAWTLAHLAGRDAAADALHYVAPVGEKYDFVARAMANIEAYLH